MTGQDWTPVVVRSKQKRDEEKKAIEQSKSHRASQATMTNNNTPAWKLEQRIDGDSGPMIVKTSADVANQIMQLRQKAGLSREQLRQQLNLPKQAIDDIESRKAPENKALNNRIIAHLNKIVNTVK